MESLFISAIHVPDDEVEVVERKGLGHPDTICDALAEALSRNLCREYQARFGRILHHNVDKALLSGGRAAPTFGGGTMLAPVDIYLAGRAVAQVGRDILPLEEIAIEGSRSWLRANLRALDADRHVRLHNVVHPGSADLQALFTRGQAQGVPLANDTSFGVGHAPLSALERLVLAAEQHLNGSERGDAHAAWGEDVKIMGVRRGDSVELTVACAMIGRYLAHVDDYLGEKNAIAESMREIARRHDFQRCAVSVNAADDPANRLLYLTVTGTSAEAGDDGQVGRGNRISGLITPCRSMSLEAAAGKNPVTHVGKLYNVAARKLAEALLAALPEIAFAQCLLVSRIGAPITSPALVQVKLAARENVQLETLRRQIEDVTAEELSRIPGYVDDFIAGVIRVF